MDSPHLMLVSDVTLAAFALVEALAAANGDALLQAAVRRVAQDLADAKREAAQRSVSVIDTTAAGQQQAAYDVERAVMRFRACLRFRNLPITIAGHSAMIIVDETKTAITAN